MEDSEENMSADDVRKTDSPSAVKKPKKRSLVERELETSLTARITSPVCVTNGLSTSRYGRARRLKTDAEFIESQKILLASIKSPGSDKTPVKIQSPTYRMHASNSPQKAETLKNPPSLLESQIDNICQENASLSRFSEETGTPSPVKKFPKVYIRKDLIQNREEDEPIMLISNLFSPTRSTSKAKTPTSNYSSQYVEKYDVKQNGHMDTSSVVKTLDFDSNKKKKKDKEPNDKDKEQKPNLSRNDLFELEAKCPYQLGDLAWARMGTFPFWPCIVTRDPQTEMFVRKKLFGRVEHSIIHVTFFGDNGRRSWVVDNMLREYLGLAEFEMTREKFTPEDKKKDPKLYAAFFISEKKQALWNLSVEEAESLYREPKRLRIDIFNDMLWKTRLSKKNPKGGKIIKRTNSDVSLSESLYDSLFSEQEEKTDDAVRSNNRSRNKSFDVSEVVTACLDNMAAKTGITKIQRQSHMDRWLQKAKSKTPEKNQIKPEPVKDIIKQPKPVAKSIKLNRKSVSKAANSFTPVVNSYRLRRRTESYPFMVQPSEVPEDTTTHVNPMMKTENTILSSIDSDVDNNDKKITEEQVITIDDDSCNNTNTEKETEISEKIIKQDEPSAKELVYITQDDSTISVDEDHDSQPIKTEILSTNEEIAVGFSLSVTSKIDSKKDPKEESEIREKKSLENVSTTESITAESRGVATDSSEEISNIQVSNNVSVEQNTQKLKEANEVSNCIMEVDNDQNDGVESQKNGTDESKKSNHSMDNSVMEVDDDTNSEMKTNGNTSPKSETVSNKSVDHNEILMACTDTNLKDALNVTTEVSVTEKKKDDTINNLPYDEQQGSIVEQTIFPDTKNNDKTSTFLDVRPSHGENMATLDPKNSSTPEKLGHESLQTRDTKKINFNMISTLSTSSNIEELLPEDGVHKPDVNGWEENEDNLLNESTQSESILQYIDDDVVENSGNKSGTSLNDSNKNESILDHSHTNSNTDKRTDELEKSVANHANGSNINLNESNESSTHQYVESPTFTQLLDSEEFFRDVNEPPDTPKLDNKDMDKKVETELTSQEHTGSQTVPLTSEPENTHELKQKVIIDCPKYVEQKSRQNEGNEASIETVKYTDETVDEYSEETTDEEPSPEYESFDEEITEDFRKHMKSIEVNIKDKKDEDQLVKICNEIAEKAKLSPTKYVPDEPVAKQIETKTKQKLETQTTNKIQLRSKKYMSKTQDKLDLSIGHINEQNNSNSTKSKNKNFNPNLEIKMQENGEHITNQEIKLSSTKEITNSSKTNIVYRTRRSMSSVKDIIPGPGRLSLKIEASKIEQFRKSAEYAPKVLLTRLEQDKLGCVKDIETTKTMDENKVLDKNDIKEETDITHSNMTPCTTHVDIKPAASSEDRTIPIKSRLSLRRDSPKSKDTDNKSRKKHSESKIEESEQSMQKTLIKQEIETTNQPSNIVFVQSDKNGRAPEPKKVDLQNISKEAKIPEPVKINGYHHEINRKFTATPDSGDTDFDIDAVSLNSEDSEISLSNSVESIPRRNLRSRPERTLENALKNPEFLKYLELNQNFLIDEHPELNEDEVLTYVYKTWQYEEDLKSDIKKIEDARHINQAKAVKNQETPRSHTKKSQPKNSIETYFREKYEQSRKTIDFAGESLPSTETNQTKLKKTKKVVKPEPDVPVSSNLEETINVSEIPRRKPRSKSSECIDLPSEKSSEIHQAEDQDLKNSLLQLNDTTTPLSEENVRPKRSSRRSKPLTPNSINYEEINNVSEIPRQKTRSKSPECIDLTSEKSSEVHQAEDQDVKNSLLQLNDTTTPLSEENVRPKRSSRRSKPLTPNSINYEEINNVSEIPRQKTRSKSPECIDLTSEKSSEVHQAEDQDVKNSLLQLNDTAKPLSEENATPKSSSRRPKPLTPNSIEKEINTPDVCVPQDNKKIEEDIEAESVDSEDSEIPLRNLRSKLTKNSVANDLNNKITPEQNENVTESKEQTTEKVIEETEETATVSNNEPVVKQPKKKPEGNSMNDPDFLNYMKLKQDAVIDENPQLTQDEIVKYMYKSWLYEESSKSVLVKHSELEEANSIKIFNSNEVAAAKKVKKRTKVEKLTVDSEIITKAKPKRRIAQPFYNENYSDIEDELELFEIFKTKKTPITVVSKTDTDKTKSPPSKSVKDQNETEIKKLEGNGESENDVQEITTEDVQYVDDTEHYFTELTIPKPSVFKGLVREKVCEICEYAGHLVKCKGCHSMFHPDCVKRALEVSKEAKKVETLQRGRKKKIRKPVRKNKSLEDSGSHSDEKQDVSADVSMEDITIPEITFDADKFESQLELKMKEMLNTSEVNYDSYSSDDGIDWRDSEAGKCDIVDVKWKRRDAPPDYSDFKCLNCQKYNDPVCFVCKNAVSKTGVKIRQKCHVAHCHKRYHLECLDQWPQTQFSSGEPSRNNKKINAHFETVTCPRHVCHTCVSDDPRGCKTRFSWDKLAKCVRCPATYHSFNKCLPAGSQVLTASHIICPRHCDRRVGKVPCHVNTGWCFICALGGSLICCEYCPTSFHAECLNIKPPEGNYMCEDCETGRLPLYGEMVWVKLGHYRWWPGIILHPSEIPDNIMLVKHDPGDFVVRFFGQYDHYWVNRGRVFPYQEGDSGRISSQKSKINEDFICAIEHAQRAYNILKNAEPDEEESLDIESSLLPPHYVKLKVNKPCGALCGRRIEDPSLSLTQCECDPNERDPCGPYSQCINRMLLTECGPTCRAGDRCMNRAFEKRQYPKLVPYRTPHRGWGLKTLDNIKAGQFVIEYVGELIDEEEFRRRMRRKHEIRDENFYFLTLDKERMIDAGPKGNVARFMNHCCEPNCETQKWTVLGDVRVGLFAIDDIPANSEVTFNYNLECAGIEKKRCLCGAKRCSGYIGAKPKQDQSQTKKIKRPYNKKKKPEESPSTSKVKTKRLGRPPKPRELTDLEKDVLIIKSATSSVSSDDSSKTSDDKIPKPIIKRKHVSNATAETPQSNCQERIEEKNDKPIRKRRISMTDYVLFSNGQELSSEEKTAKALKRKRVSNATEEVSLTNSSEPHAKKQKCEEKLSEVGD